jgi:DNA-binding transcriptional LysR family regulator
MGDHLRRGLLVEVGPVVTTPGHGYFLHWPPALTHDPGFRRFDAWLSDTITGLG